MQDCPDGNRVISLFAINHVLQSFPVKKKLIHLLRPNSFLKITGKETSNIIVEISLSINKSFEWTEVINDGKRAPAKENR